MVKKITALQPQKRNPNRVNVHLDGEFAFGLARIVAAWLQVGQELTPEKIARLQEDDAAEVALQRAVRFLSYRPRSVKEVEDNLRKHETPEHVIASIIERLTGSGVINDQKFARLWIENRSEFRPRGSFALRTELRQKGIADKVIEDVLADLDEDELAYAAGRKKAPKIKAADEHEFKRKMYGFLSRRGFSYQTISEVVQKIWQEQQSA